MWIIKMQKVSQMVIIKTNVYIFTSSEYIPSCQVLHKCNRLISMFRAVCKYLQFETKRKKLCLLSNKYTCLLKQSSEDIGVH